MINVENLKPFPKFCYTIGMIPTSYKVSLTYEEQLTWFCDFLENTVIPTVNNNGMAVQELQNLYVQLKNYVDTYFENLDVQVEINNKLDEMAKSGVLADIIAAYIQLKGILAYNTVQDMKEATNLVNGSFAKTYGFHTLKDGGEALYKIRNITNTDNVNEINLFALSNENLVAELIAKNNINIKQLGAYGDNENDDTEIIQFAINNFTNIYIPKGIYKISEKITIPQGKIITGAGTFDTNLRFNTLSTAIEIKYTAFGKLKLRDFSIYNNTSYNNNDTTSCGIDIAVGTNNRNVTNFEMKNIAVRYFYINFRSLTANNLLNSVFNDCLFQNGYYNTRIIGGFANYFNRCQFTNAHIGLFQKSGEGNFLQCLIEGNDIGIDLQNSGGKYSFIDCFFENVDKETAILFNIDPDNNQVPINLIDIKNCHFYGGHIQLYAIQCKILNLIGNTFKNVGDRHLVFATTDTNRENFNILGNIFETPQTFANGSKINFIEKFIEDTGWVDVDTTGITFGGTFSNFQMRKVGKLVKWRGTLSQFTDEIKSTSVNIIPEKFRPDQNLDLIASMRDSTAYETTANIRVYSAGTLQIRGYTATSSTSNIIALDGISYFTA